MQGLGIDSVVKESTAGQYTITFSDKFNKLLELKCDVYYTTATGIAKIDILENPATFQASIASNKQAVIQCYDYAGVATNAASGSALTIKAVFRNSSVSKG